MPNINQFLTNTAIAYILLVMAILLLAYFIQKTSKKK